MNRLINKQKQKIIASFLIFFLIGCLFITVFPTEALAATPAKNNYSNTGGNELTTAFDFNLDGMVYSDDYFDSCTTKPNGIVKVCAFYIAFYQCATSNMLMKTGSMVSDTILLKGFSSSLNGAFSKARALLKTSVLPPLQAIGFGLVAMFFLIKLVEHTISQQMTLESFFKMFTKLAVGVFAIEYSPQIFDLFFNLGEELATLVGSSISGSSVSAQSNVQLIACKLADQMTEAGGLSWMLTIVFTGIVTIIMFLICIVLLIIAFVVSFTRIFEVLIRGSFLPLGLAFLAENGWQGGGGRYFKKYLACCCQCMVLVLEGNILTYLLSKVMPSATDQLANSGFWGASGLVMVPTFIIAVALAISGFGVMFKSQGVVNDIFGV